MMVSLTLGFDQPGASAPKSLWARDARAIAGVEKLRFFPLEVVSGYGSTLVETGGRELLDLSSTWTASGLGHGHPAVTAAIVAAAQRPPGAGGLSAVNPDMVGLAEDLLSIVPGAGERRVYLGLAGSDANDVVLRACRHATGRLRVLTFEHSYHGGVGLAMGVSGVHVDAGASPAAGAAFLPYPDPLRPHTGDIDTAVADIVQRAETEMAIGDVACLIVEPIQSDGGLIIPPEGFLAALATLCEKHQVVMICDEVKVGLGRLGTLHAFTHDGVVPDIVTFGKALGGGLPLSAAVGPANLLDSPTGSALLTAAGNPICAAAGRAVLRAIVNEDLPARAAAAGTRLQTALRAEVAHAGIDQVIGQIRGRGLAIGIDLVTDRETNNPNTILAQKAVFRAWQLGAVLYYVGDSVLEVTPPLIITDEEVDYAATILVQAISDVLDDAVSDKDIAPYAGW